VTYGGLLRFGAVGMTLSVYLDTGLGLAGIRVPFWFFIALALTIAYVGFGTFVSVPKLVDVEVDRDFDDWRPSRQPEDDYGENQADDGGFKSGRP
jgi:hypothetical protein